MQVGARCEQIDRLQGDGLLAAGSIIDMLKTPGAIGLITKMSLTSPDKPRDCRPINDSSMIITHWQQEQEQEHW